MLSVFSVTEAVAETSLLSVAELREAVGVTGGAQDVRLLKMGRAVSMALSRRCCVRDDGSHPPTLLRETCTETFRWSGCGPISLARRPVASIVSVTLDGAAVDSESYELAGRYVHHLSSGDLSDWTAGRITVVYIAGYAPAPDDLKLAAAKLVTAINAEAARDPSLKRESVPGLMDKEYWVAPSHDPLISREIDDLLSPYIERHL